MRKIEVSAAILLVGLALSAQGKGNALTPVDGLDNWKYSLDLSGYAPGKYNLIVEARNKAGNVTRAAPMNIFIDPKADLPIVSIINPIQLQRVGGDLNIVGTCAAAKGIDHVEFSLDGGEYVKADGKEFWSYYLKTKDIEEGRRTLDVRGVDVNGLVGPVARVRFDLDRNQPVATVDKPAIGSLVSGQIRLTGTVFDANGVRSLEISQDEGKTWAKVDLKLGKDKLRPSFVWPVDTKKLGDGPKVFDLRSVAKVGTSSTAAYLVFVDNTKPVIEVARPAAGQSIHARFSLVGAVRHVLGVKRLSYELSTGEKGEIPLTKGDPFFVKDFDVDKAKGDGVTLTLVAEDPIGNATRLVKVYKIDRKGDRPALKVLGPSSGTVVRAGDVIWGSIAAYNGAAGFRWSIDGKAPVEASSTEAFSLALPPESSGKHVLSLVPVDADGHAGDPTIFPFALDNGPGAVKFDRITSAKASRDFAQGAQVSVDSGEFLEGAVSTPNLPSSATYSIAGGTPKPALLAKAADGSWRFRIALDRSLSYGFAPIALRVKDSAGNGFEGDALLYVTDYAVAREDTGFRFSDPRVGADGRIVFGPGAPPRPVLGAFYGGELSGLRFDPVTDLVAASYDGRVVTISAAKDGTSVPTRLIGKTSTGHEFSAGPFVFVTDSTPPTLTIDSPAEGSWFNSKLVIAGKAVDAAGAVTLGWRRLPDGQSSKAAVKPDGSFSIELSSSDLPAGPISIEVEATDAGGNVARAYRSFGGAAGPVLRFLSPEEGAAVWGPEDVAAAVDDASDIASVEYAADGKSFSPIEWDGRYFVHRADLAANPNAAYRVTDKAGNATVARPKVLVGPPPARAQATGSLSIEPSTGEAKVELAGTAGSLKVSLTLPGLSEAAFNALGDSSSPPPQRFATRLLVPGALSLKGQATVDGQAKTVSLSMDGGATYSLLASNKDAKSAKSALPFGFASEASKLQNGAARWVLKIEDFAGDSFFCPIYSLVDTKAPSLAAIYPEKGVSAMPGPFPLVVKAEDENGLAFGEIAGLPGAKATGPAAKESLGVETGGRYFARMIDPGWTAAKAVPVAIGITARDPAGNQTALALKYGYAPASPKIRLDSPIVDAKGDIAPLEADAFVAGLATGSAGAVPARVSIDGGEALSFPSGAFALSLSALGAGKHSITIEAGDPGSGITKLAKTFTLKGPAPALGDFKISDGKSSSPWTPGGDFALGASSAIAGSVSAPNGLASVSVSIDGGAPIQAALGKPAGGAVSFSAPLPAGLAFARVTIELIAKDILGMTGTAKLELHKILPSAATADDAEGLRFADSRIVLADGKTSFLLAPGDKLVGRFNGRPIKTVAISPESPSLAAAFDGSSVSIEAAAAGIVPSATLTVQTVDGDSYSWGPFSAAVDAEPPAVEVAAPSDGDWTRGEVRVAGKATDSQGIDLVKVSVDGGDPTTLFDAAVAEKAAAAVKPATIPPPAKVAINPLSAKLALASADAPAPPTAPVAPVTAPAPPPAVADGHEASFDAVLPLAAAPDGATRLDFIVRDKAGLETRVMRFINKDTVPPALTQVVPAVGEKVHGLTTFVGEASDAGRVASVSFLAKANAKGDDVVGLGTFSRDLDLSHLDMPLAEGGGFVATDKAGNKAILAPTVVVDKEADKPIVEIHAPSEMEVLRGDFVISGVAYGYVGVAAVYYRIDGGGWTKLDMPGTGFSVPIALKDTTDNEHLVEAKAEDMYGVQSDVVSRKYRISKEEPVALMTAPSISKPVHGTVKLMGTASDANGIKEVTVSVDNRTSYDRPVGTERWSLDLDTTTLSDGIHAIAVRPVDGYDTEGFYATMITVDNTPPKAQLDMPRDGDEEASTIAVSGRVSDNLAVASSRIEIAPVGANSPPQIVLDLGTDKIVQRAVDISSLKPGVYTVRLVVVDRADNVGLASRNVNVVGGVPVDTISIAFPVEGERPSARLKIQGQAKVASGAGSVSVLADGNVLGAADPDELGWYSLDLPAGALGDGPHALKARTTTKDGRVIESPETRIEWSSLGSWVSIDSLPSGKYLSYRPYLRGTAGWTTDATPPTGDKKAMEAYAKAAKSRAVAAVEVSLDDGRTFAPAKGTTHWSFRLETQDYKEGALRVIARARYADGTTSSVKAMYFLDKTPPEVQVLSPSEGGRFNGILALSGRAYDLIGLQSVGIALRKGDKASYEVPSFIQGLYVDGQVLGGTTWETGLGLTFFGDNVKLQALYGQAPTTDSSGNQESFYGTVFGAKLIANIFYLPFDSLLGPDWSFLSTSLGLGANFTYFTQTQSGGGLLVSSVFGQFEFPKLTLSGSGAFRKFSLYTEYQIWVLSSVVAGGFIPKLSFGARISVF